MIKNNEKLLDKITVDLYNRKIILRSEENSLVVFKCSSVNSLIELIQKCKDLLKTDNIYCR